MAADDVPRAAPLLTFRPDIEGLRAVAVGVVVAVHAGVTGLSGGYVGVDVFFVISGFLITSLLIDEVRTTGRISIVSFYARRSRRILPVACFVIAATVVATYLRLGVLVGRSTAIDGRWAAGFAANIRLIQQGTNYFASSVPSPLQHFWSLAVEEQFYVVWPTLLFGVILLGRRYGSSTAATRLAIAAIFGASLYLSIHQTRLEPTTAYFSPLTRAWELGAGALVAVFPIEIGKVPAALRAALTWIGLGMVAITAFTFSASTAFPGYAALLPVGGTVLVIAGGIGVPPGGASLALGLRPLRYLGKISYSVYLWHWPVLVIAAERSATPLSNEARVVCILITLVLSVASYRLIERPLHAGKLLKAPFARTDWAKSRKALLAGATAVVVAATVSTLTNERAESLVRRAEPSRQTARHTTLKRSASLDAGADAARLQQTVTGLVRDGLALHEIPDDLDPPVLGMETTLDPTYRACDEKQRETAVRTCTFGKAGSSKTLLVFGDSHAMQWMPALDPYAKRAGYRLVSLYKSGCPLPSFDVFDGSRRYWECNAWRPKALQYIQRLKPDIIFIAYSSAATGPNEGTDPAIWKSGLETSMRAVVATGARIVELGPNARLDEDPTLCLSRPNADPSDCTTTFEHRDLVAIDRQIVEAAGGVFIDVEPWFCVDRRCPVIIDKRVAYADPGHVSRQVVTELRPLLEATLKAAGMP